MVYAGFESTTYRMMGKRLYPTLIAVCSPAVQIDLLKPILCEKLYLLIDPTVASCLCYHKLSINQKMLRMSAKQIIINTPFVRRWKIDDCRVIMGPGFQGAYSRGKKYFNANRFSRAEAKLNL